MAEAYDNRQFRTVRDLVIPAGTAVTPMPDGSGRMDDGSDSPLVATFPLAEAIELGLVELVRD